ncbi:hypothetical protein ACFFX0_09430 [Citricoccus parietis]|uniref:Uncharacterized protein n=1 Tax=Citricoccus parietis TaxID=592307 RepID=A0ABV5FXJ7_9MICC
MHSLFCCLFRLREGDMRRTADSGGRFCFRTLRSPYAGRCGVGARFARGCRPPPLTSTLAGG